MKRSLGSGSTRSVWMDVELPRLSPLREDVEADVCVVGAGLAGVTTAYLLARAGRSVVVIDKAGVAGGETSRTTAHLVSAMDDRFAILADLHGDDGAGEAYRSHAAAIDRIETIVREERIDCSFRRLDGYLLAAGPDDREIHDEYEVARRVGVLVEWSARAPIPRLDSGPCLRFPNQGTFHPLRYLRALVEVLARRGARLFGDTRAVAIEAGDAVSVETMAGLRIRCRAAVVATATPFHDRVAVHTRQAPYRTFVIAARVPSDTPDALLWSNEDPYVYVRRKDGRSSGDDLLIVGGEDHKTGQEHDQQERLDRLEAWARERFPIGPVEYRWSGQVFEPVDGLGFMGRDPTGKENVYLITGDSGQGMTHGTLGAMIVSDAILGRPNPWEALYAPDRKRVAALPEWARENLNVGAQYADWVTPGEAKDPGAVPRGKGAVVRRGIRKVAVFHDEDGTLHERSAVCTHLGCLVSWNDLEKSWDCPCHGSRFDAKGGLLCGPASRDLAPTDEGDGGSARNA